MHTFTFKVFTKATTEVLFEIDVNFTDSSASIKPKKGNNKLFNTMGELACYLDAKYTLCNVKQRTFTEGGYLTKDYDSFVYSSMEKQLDENLTLKMNTDRGAPIRAEGIDLWIIDKRGDYKGNIMRTPSTHSMACRSFEELYFALTAYID